jgi:hypothetical protein
MLASDFVNIRRVSLPAAALIVAAFAAVPALAACSSDESIGGPTKAATTVNGSAQATTAPAKTQAAPTPTPNIGTYPGPDPKLGGNITAISPTNGQAITQLDSQSPNATKPRGICFVADFTDLPENEGPLWMRMALDGNEVTEQLTWLVATKDNPTGGRACYAPEKGLPVGKHSAAVSVQNPSNPNEPPKQLVAWKFEIKP